MIQIGFLGLAFVKFDAPFEDNESLVIEPILNLIIRITINLQSAMGCGASADNKTTLQTIPLSQIQNNSPQNPAVVTSSPPQQLEKTAKVQQKKSNAKQQPEKKDLKTSTNKEQTKPKTDSKTNLQNSTTDIRSSSTQKRPDSLSKTQHQAKGSQGELRSSSLSKSQSSSKINGGSAANKKAGNPQELQKMKLAESVIQQEEVRATQPREKEKTVKKIKSVKNNKELTDLIKIYGL